MDIFSKIEPGLATREQAYRENFLRADTRFATIVITVLNLFMAAMVVNDYLFFTASPRFFALLFCRSLFLLASIAAVFGLRKQTRINERDRLIFIYSIIALSCMLYIHYTRPADYRMNHVWNMFVIFWTYIYYPFRLVRRVAAALFFSLGIIAVLMAQESAFGSQPFNTILFSVLGANIMGLLFSVRWNNMRREMYQAMIDSSTARERHKASEEKMRGLNIELKKARDNLLNVFENSADAIAVVDRRGYFTEWNHAAEHLYGYSTDELKGQSFAILYPDPDRLKEMLGLLRKQKFVRRYEIEMRNKSGDILPFELSISLLTDSTDQKYGSVCVARDLTQRKKMEEDLRRLAATDPLTGANNRRSFMEKGRYELMRSRRYHHPFAVLMLDVDHFKKINDTHGHDMGDQVLKKLVDCSHDILRGTDRFGRLGGEEFAVILPETGRAAALTVAHRFLEELAAIRITAETGTIQFTVSIGLTLFEKTDDTLETILGRADAALYKAKANGRNRVVSI